MNHIRPHFNNPDLETRWLTGHFLNSIKEGKITTEALLNDLIGKTDELVQNLAQMTQHRILMNADQGGFDPQLLDAFFQQHGFFQPNSIFTGVATTAQRTNFLRNEFELENFEPILMGQRLVFDGNQHKFIQGYGYRKNFLSSLRRQLRNPNVLYHVANPHSSTDGILRDDCDGTNTRNHPFVHLYPDALRIRLYYDDVELTEAIGSYKRKVGE